MTHNTIVLVFSSGMLVMAGLLMMAFQMMLDYLNRQRKKDANSSSEGSLKTPLIELGVKSNFAGLILVFLGVSLIILEALLA